MQGESKNDDSSSSSSEGNRVGRRTVRYTRGREPVMAKVTSATWCANHTSACGWLRRVTNALARESSMPRNDGSSSDMWKKVALLSWCASVISADGTSSYTDIMRHEKRNPRWCHMTSGAVIECGLMANERLGRYNVCSTRKATMNVATSRVESVEACVPDDGCGCESMAASRVVGSNVDG